MIEKLSDIFNKHNCDKTAKHGYHKVYGPDFEKIRDKPINILEIGIFNGDSLKAWLDYFPEATVYGIDVFKRIASADVPILEHERVKYLKGDSTNPVIKTQIMKEWPRTRFDIIIDDGMHTPSANAKTLENLYPLLKKNGRMYIEDVWPIDLMTTAEMNHPWMLKHPDRYNILEQNKLTAALQGKDIQRFDLRGAHEPDSYIISVG